SRMLGDEFREMLRCIRCGACINHCPIYAAVGGHAYGWVYSGPMGAVLIPNLIGIEEAGNLPNASTLCGRCEEVCPMQIPLPRMLRQLRERQHEARKSPPAYRYGLAGWAFLARWPALYRLATGIGVGALGRLGRLKRNGGRFRSLPLAQGWTGARDLPAPQGQTFQQQWSARGGRRA
ncbi:MAG: 4Fe-4S dicluster domain-containing protein, partial [Rhodospirillales bacterium]|nr:4Fe-4S dicluster domain-containing protein [Rhodospirillales bacterium]